MKNWLENQRKKIDKIDETIIQQLSLRYQIVDEIGKYKINQGLSVMQQDRVDQKMIVYKELSKKYDLSEEFVQAIFKAIINEACKIESKQAEEIKEDQQPVFCTLGPEETCHGNAVAHFLAFHKLDGNRSKIFYINDFEEAVKKVKSGSADYIIQNIAHPQVALLNEKYRKDVYIIDSFIFPTKPMGILKRKDTNSSEKSIGFSEAAKEYLDLMEWESLHAVNSNPLVLEGLLRGDYNYGITFEEFAEKNPEQLELVTSFGGPVDTCWVVYGSEKRNIYHEVLADKTMNY